MDPFEKAAQGVAGGFDDAAAQVVDTQQTGLRNTLYSALLANPDMAARATRLGRQTGLAPELVERNLPEVERSTRLDQLDALPKENPVLAAWLADPVNARLAHDDLDILGQVSQAALFRPPAAAPLRDGYGFAQASRDLRTAQDRSASAVSQYVERNMPRSEVYGVERTAVEGVTEPILRGVARARRGLTLLMGMAGLYEGDPAGLAVRLASQNRKVESYPVPENVQQGQRAISDAEGFGEAAWAILTHPGAVKETVFESLGASAPSLLGAAGLSVFGPAGTAAGAGTGSFVVEYSSTLQDVMDENGVNASDPMALHAALNNPELMAAAREKALARGVPVAAFDAITAGFTGKLLLGAKPTAGSAAARTAGELGLQAGGGAAGEATAQYNTDEFKPGDILLEAIAELPSGVVEVPANYRHARDKAARAEQQAKAVEELNNLAKASKAAARDSETFQTLIAAAAEDGPVQQVYIDGKTLMQSGLAPELAKALPSVAAQLDRALLTGGQIAIPVEEYAARIAPTDLAPQLLDHLKTEPDGFTRAEARQYMQDAAPELQAEVERILTEKQGDDAFKQSAEAVRGTIKTQLDTAGRFTPQVNDAYSALVGNWYAVQAARLGTTPEELYQRYPLKVGAEAVAGQRFDQGGKLDDVRQQWTDAGIQHAISERDGTITLSQIVVPEAERGTGKGTAAMQALVDYADRTGQHIVLSPSSDFGGGKKRLIEFYKRFGFVENKGKNRAFSTSESMYRQAQGKVLYQSSGQSRDAMQELAALAATGANENKVVEVAPVAEWEASAARDQAGVEIAGYRHTADLYAVRHAFKKHGDAAKEAARNQLPITADDIASIPEVLTQPDSLILGLKNARGQDLVFSVKAMADGTMLVVEEVRTGKKALALASLRKVPGAKNAKELLPSVLLNARNDAGSKPIVVDAPRQFNQGARGAFNPETLQITLLKNADLSTFLHESGHAFLEIQFDIASRLQQEAQAFGIDALKPGERELLADTDALLRWFGVRDLAEWYSLDFEEKRVYHEQFARGFEAYLFEGSAPSIELQGLFQRFRAWLLNVYKELKALNVELSDEVRGVFDRMLASNEQIQLAEQGRSMMPLFSSPEQAGMTPEEFAAYQALGVDATNEAIQDLQGRGLRDMQWLHNTRGRVIKQLKKASAARRAEMQMDARREVMSQPLYRAWDFLTRKLTDNDKLPPLERKSDPDVLNPTLDSLFVAIAKLGGIRKDQVLSEWGVDPKDTPQSGLFGKPVWRLKDGLTLDGMAEALAEHGYLPLDEHGKYELNDLGDRFLEELAGNPQYSHAYQPQDLQPGEQVNNPAGLTAGRLDLGALAAMGVPDEVVNAVKARKMTAKDGLHPDLVAELFGFSSGDELVRALAAAETPKAEIDALTDVRMLENYGDLSSPEAIEKAADRAIHNDVRARMVATEANALAKATGQRKVLASAAREFAAAMIDRLKVRAVKPGQYANAEVRAAKAAEKASRAGDIATAASEKRNQLVNTYATRAAYDALDDVDAGLRYLKKFGKVSKTLDPDYQDQIDAMLERFDLKPVSNRALDKRKSLAQWIEAQREAGLEPDIAPELENEANRKSYKDMTVEEFRGLIDTVKQIEHLGRLKHKLLTAQDQRAFGVIVDEVAASIVENGGKARPVELETPSGIRPWLEGFAAGHRKLASLIRQMDGLKDNGPFWRVLVRGMNEAATAEAVMNEQATVALAELYKPLLDMKGGLNGDKQFIPEINDSLTRGGRLSVALNWGNTTNRARIMDGDGWSEAQVNAILKRLTRAEWDFVNGMWAYIDSYWPQIEAKEKRVTGRAPDKVKADPFRFTMDNGETVDLTGGYYPIKYDSNRDDRAEKLEAAEVAKDMMRGAFTRSTTRRGHTKARVEGVRRPVKKTLDVITQHVSEVTHDLAWHEWLIDANRLLNAKPINQAIREHYGTEVIRTMKDALTGIATADIVPQTKVDTALLYLRANVSRSTMGLSLTTAFLQPFGLAQSMVRIGSRHVLRGMARWAGDAARFESSMTWIGEKSDFMRLRNKTFNRELHEIKGRVSKGHSKARTVYDASLFLLMQKMQMVADVPTWIGAYERALAEGHDDATAVSLADQAVLDSQGGGQTKDMAEFQRKHPFLTMFYSYFNTTLNLAAESTAQTDFKNPLAVAGWASDMALLMVIPALAPAILLALMRGDECDDAADCAKKLAQAQAGYLLGTMLGVRELSGSVAGYDYAGPPVGRVVNELGRFGTQVSQGEADEAAAMSAVSLLGVSLGIPTTQILRSWRGWNAWEEGDAPASSILLGPPPKD